MSTSLAVFLEAFPSQAEEGEDTTVLLLLLLFMSPRVPPKRDSDAMTEQGSLFV